MFDPENTHLNFILKIKNVSKMIFYLLDKFWKYFLQSEFAFYIYPNMDQYDIIYFLNLISQINENV